MSSILRRAVYPVMSHAGVFSRRFRAGEVCAITYHGVRPEGFTPSGSPTDDALVSAEQLRRQLQFLKSRYNLVTPQEFHHWCKGDHVLPERAVLLTCDDGLLNGLTDVLPILIEQGASCLFFVTGASAEQGVAYLWYEELYKILEVVGVERIAAVCKDKFPAQLARNHGVRVCWQYLLRELSKLSWSDRRAAMSSLQSQLGIAEHPLLQTDSLAERRYRLLNPAELRQLAAAGMTIGAHTMDHPVLAEMTPELAEIEIRECRSRLEATLQQEVWALAYPFGDEHSAGHREADMAEHAGYSCAFMNGSGGCFGRTSPRYALPRTHVTSAMEIPEMEARLIGFFEPFRKRVAAMSARARGG